ncbi:MAG: TraB/GumN family protein [Deltaproteobacteria bacterium]|nr:TraB/GumN family protein [Deltaproteobacteria bacterium]
MRSLAVAFVIAVVAACGGGKPVCRLPPELATAPRDAPPFLWKATRDDGATVWLYGTIHNGGRADVAEAAWRALAASPGFASELGDTEPDPDKMRAIAMVAGGKGIDQLLPANDWYDLRDELRGVVKEDVLRRARPWYAMTQLMSKVAPSPSPTMDFALAKAAREKRKTVDALERWEEQLGALDQTVKIADLQQAIRARGTMGCDLASLLATYRTGDLPAMERRLIVEGTAQLLGPRNKLWLPRIAAYFDRGGGFVAVGLGHMIGEDGLPALLARTGYKVERIDR